MFVAEKQSLELGENVRYYISYSFFCSSDEQIRAFGLHKDYHLFH